MVSRLDSGGFAPAFTHHPCACLDNHVIGVHIHATPEGILLGFRKEVLPFPLSSADGRGLRVGLFKVFCQEMEL